MFPLNVVSATTGAAGPIVQRDTSFARATDPNDFYAQDDFEFSIFPQIVDPPPVTGPRNVWFDGAFTTGEIQPNGQTPDGYYVATLPEPQQGDEAFTVTSGGFGPGSGFDLTVERSWQAPSNPNGPGDLITPRAGEFFVRMLTDRNKNYSKVADGKTRNEFHFARNPTFQSEYDEEYWTGISIYIPTNWEYMVDETNDTSALMCLEAGAQASRDLFELLIVPNDGQREDRKGPFNSWWFVWQVSDSSLSNVGRFHVDAGRVDDDLGLWTDFIIRYRQNPFSTTTNPRRDLGIGGAADRTFQGNKGILQMWKSTGPYLDEFRNREMQLLVDLENEPVGLVPDNQKIRVRPKMYPYDWWWKGSPKLDPNAPGNIASRFSTSVTGPMVMCMDSYYIARAADGGGYSDVHPTLQPMP